MLVFLYELTVSIGIADQVPGVIDKCLGRSERVMRQPRDLKEDPLKVRRIDEVLYVVELLR